MRFLRWPQRRRHSAYLVTAIVAATASLVTVSYWTVTEWRRNAAALAVHRADAVVDLLVTALLQDMRAVQVTILSDRQPDVTDSTPRSLHTLVTNTLARYPYPDVFFSWHSKRNPPMFYSRSDRHPAWLPQGDTSIPSPVRITSEPAVSALLMRRVTRDADAGKRYSIFDTQIRGSHYQVVALLSYEDELQRQLKGVVAFLVDLAWIRDHYFPALVAQIAPPRTSDGGLEVTILNGDGTVVLGSDPASSGVKSGRRTFRVHFFDPRLVAMDWPSDLDRQTWTAFARVSEDPAVIAANVGARRALIVAALMSVVIVIGFIVISLTQRAAMKLADLRSEFVSTVTHELKTPLATIHTVNETFASGRGLTPELSMEYGRLGVHESKRLARLIDNLLAYSRVTDTANVYTFVPIRPDELIRETLEDFASQLEYNKFDIQLDIAEGLPHIRGDRRALGLALDNVIDNAIRYSGASGHRTLVIRASASDIGVCIQVCDHGIGISQDELPRVTQKFFSGRRGSAKGSGLGLAIVQRIVTDHDGKLSIDSRVGEGTTVRLELPVVKSTEPATPPMFQRANRSWTRTPYDESLSERRS